MTINYSQTKLHWNYFLTLERDFETVARFIEPCEANNNVFSMELARLIMAATQEVDVVLKLLCRLVVPQSTADRVNAYHSVIVSKVPDLIHEEIRTPRYGMSSRPWIGWSEQNPPQWWTANNKIKHQRSQFYHQATLSHAFNALGGLLVTIAYYYNRLKSNGQYETDWRDVTETLSPSSTIFYLNEKYYH